ncbi:uncharacterized protein LOC110853636 [Folsomia candida]|uniref:uncharacterized protein LOC110853636 n=1 Tax=Folsomia candida TaxID=158441 RepID=UPI001605259E|nr:uncharacterized protein LOC110853636 [Folsomia candida]
MPSDKEEIFYANDLYCDDKMNYLCDVNPPCPPNEQYHCPYKGLRVMNPEDDVDEDADLCKFVKYQQILDTPLATYYKSDTDLTWVGAMNCLKKNNFTPASYQDEEDIEFFNEYIPEESTDPKNPFEAWNTASSWRRGGRGDILKWEDGSTVNDAHLIEFHTHDEIDPVCGKTMQHLGEVGIMSENCLRRLKFFYKIRKASVPDILAIQICPRHAVMKSFYSLCNATLVTVNPKSKNDTRNSTIFFPKANFQTLSKIRFQNKLLKNIVVDFNLNGDHLPSVYAHHPHRAFKLLSLSSAIYIKLCPKVNPDLIVSAFRYFHYLDFVTSQKRTELVSAPDYKWINRLLHECLVNSTSFRYRTDRRTDNCSEQMSSVFVCQKEQPV